MILYLCLGFFSSGFEKYQTKSAGERVYFSSQLKPSMFGKSSPQEPEAVGDIIPTVTRQGAKNIWAPLTFFFLHSAGTTLRKWCPHFRARLPISVTLISVSFWCARRRVSRCSPPVWADPYHKLLAFFGFWYQMQSQLVALVIYSNVKCKHTQMLVLQRAM